MLFPLRTSEAASRFPWPTVAWVSLWAAIELLGRLWIGPRENFLALMVFRPGGSWAHVFTAVLAFPGFVSFLVGLLFAWVFTPRVFERRGPVFVIVLGLSAAFLSLYSFQAIHPASTVPLLAPDAFLGAVLGAFMRREIWGTVSTLVLFVHRRPAVFEVPAYVLLFFWFFYIFIGNLFISPLFADAPMLYWIPFVSFLWGFAVESVWP